MYCEGAFRISGISRFNSKFYFYALREAVLSSIGYYTSIEINEVYITCKFILSNREI